MHVIATQRGFAGGVLREIDAPFDIDAKDFNSVWMKPAAPEPTKAEIEATFAPASEPKTPVSEPKPKGNRAK